ncbi:dystonin isoform X3 [Lepisosteus oculatus]|uniref:dystonin isoform X3 n=1 Tax=Lepisosteus oculatus TaxID=7918 RepID=UPI0035F5231D
MWHLLCSEQEQNAQLVKLMCCMDERDRVQKKTFTKWINQHLMKVRKHVNDLYEDLRDGHNLISLLEVLSGESLPRERDFLKTLRLVSAAEACAFEQHGDEQDEDKGPREKGRMRFHRLQNVQIALDFLKKRQVKLVNIRNDDITDGNPKLTLGLIWTIILHFQISDIHVTGESEDMSAKEKLLLWSRQMTEGYVGVRCENFTTSWRDGRLFNAIIHKYRPDLVDMNRVSSQNSRSNLEQAFSVAEQLGVARLLDPEDVDVQSPDEKSVITYVSTLYDVFPKVPEGGEGISANDVDIKWVEYQNMVKYLMQWIKHHVTVMSDRMFPNSPVELKALYNQYLQFKDSEIPPKENEKSKIKQLYKMLEVWIEFGRIKLPQGYHPNEVEKEWGKLIVGMLEREKSLRPEVERLEMLQQIANRVQRDCVAGEDKLVLARNALQSDAKRLESGIQFQNEAEIAGYLLECENLLRQQVVDIQILLDGKYYLADQLVQRVSKIRDDLLTLKAECSSVYSKGRTLTTEQTKLMISGITQSLNSGFSQNLNPGLTPSLTPGLMPGVSPGLTTAFTSSLSPSLTPSFTPAMTPGLQPLAVQSYAGGMDSGALQQLKLMQIRKPLMKSSLADPNMTEEEVNMNFVQDLLNWVEEMQVQLDRAEWGSDLPSVESHLENHRNVHGAIEEFQMSLKEAKISEIQMTSPQKLSYSEKLNKLENYYGKLLNTSRSRQKYLESLQDFVSRATQELIWLNEKEEEEVAYDWSDRNSNMAKKRDYHADLMRELDEKEGAIKSVQEIAEHLLLENHPARLTIEAYRAAMQTQWGWILQLCGCVEQHLKENALYFEFFNDAKESLDYLKNLQDAIQRKYGCDRSSSLHKLEDLIQESMDEKEQLLQYRSTVASLVGRAKTVVQLKPRNPDSPIRTSIPVKAICDYRQIEITVYKEDECVLASNTHRAKWKIISPTGNEAMVPSVCFTVPPPNKEAIDMATRIEQLYQNVLTLWHRSHINMKSIVSWRYLMNDIEAIRNGNVASIKTMLPGEHQQVLSNLQSHFEDFLEDSQESEIFTVSDRAQLEREVEICKEFYKDLLKSAEREEQEESVYNLFISEVRNFRMRLEGCEERLIRQIRTPLERDDLQESILRISEQEKYKKELDKLKEDLETMKEKCEVFVSQASSSPSVPTLSSELNVLIQNMNQVYSMSSIYLEKLKTVSLVLKHSQGAEAVVKLYETKLCEEDAVNADTKAIEIVMSTLKQWRTEIDEKREVFHDLEDELQKARSVSDRMFKTHNERDFDLDWHKEKADQLAERWQNIHSQIESRLRDLEGISKSLKYYRDTYSGLDRWIKEMEATQLKMQENQPEDSKSLAELLNQQKVLVSEIELKQSTIDECQKYAEHYSAAVKDYELQLMTYRAMVDSQQKSPVKRRRMQSSSDVIIQEFMDLRTRYTALVTLMTQYVKFASETLKRTEEDEYSSDEGEFCPSVEMENVPNEAGNSGSAVTESSQSVLRSRTYISKRDCLLLSEDTEQSPFPASDQLLHALDLPLINKTTSKSVCSNNNLPPRDNVKTNSDQLHLTTVFPKADIEHSGNFKKLIQGTATGQEKSCLYSSSPSEQERQPFITGCFHTEPIVCSRAELKTEPRASQLSFDADQRRNFFPHILTQNLSDAFESRFEESPAFSTKEHPDSYVCRQKLESEEVIGSARSKILSSEIQECSPAFSYDSILQIIEEGDELSPYQKSLIGRESKESRRWEGDLVSGEWQGSFSFSTLTASPKDQNDPPDRVMAAEQGGAGCEGAGRGSERLHRAATQQGAGYGNEGQHIIFTECTSEVRFMQCMTELQTIVEEQCDSDEATLQDGEPSAHPLTRSYSSVEDDMCPNEQACTLKDTIGNTVTGDNFSDNYLSVEGDGKQQTRELHWCHRFHENAEKHASLWMNDPLIKGRKGKHEQLQCTAGSLVVWESNEDDGLEVFLTDPTISKAAEINWLQNKLTALEHNQEITKCTEQLTEQQRLENDAQLNKNKEKSVEEEKKEHNEKVSKLLNWVSGAKTCQGKEDKAFQDGKTGTRETSSKPQISAEEIAAKKEQIAEALNSTQVLLAKHSDKMSEEERQETKEQLRSLQQAYSDLSQQGLGQLQAQQSLPAEQDFQTIEGIIDLESGAVYSVCRSVQKGLIDYTTGIRLLEAQLITSGLILPEFRMCLDLEDAFKHSLVDEQVYLQLQKLNEANKWIMNAQYSSEPLPVVAAFKGGAISEQLAIKVIEIKLASGGLRVTYTGDVLSLEKAFQKGMIPPPLFIKILERQNTWKDLIDPNTAEKVSLVQLIQRSVTYEETGLRLLPVKKGRDGKIALKSGREISVLRAVHEGLIDRETMFRLLGAQLFAGGLVDPKTGHKLSLEEALNEGLIDQDTASGILSYQAQNGGIVNPHTGDRLTVDEAVQCNLISSSSALLVLEKQKGFMGFIWPHSGEILTVSTSLQHEVIPNQLTYKLLNNRQKIAAFYIPESSEVVGIEDAAKEGLIDRTTANVLMSIEIPDVFPDIEDLNNKISSWLSLREVQIEGPQQSSQDIEISELEKNCPSPTEAKELFISYIMMNSYMDPKSGQRLLIYDGQLTKMTHLFAENIEEPNREQEHDILCNVVSSPVNYSDVQQSTETILDNMHIKHNLPRNEDSLRIEQKQHTSGWHSFLRTEENVCDTEATMCSVGEKKGVNYSDVGLEIDLNSGGNDKMTLSGLTRPDSDSDLPRTTLYIEEGDNEQITPENKSVDITVLDEPDMRHSEPSNTRDIIETDVRSEGITEPETRGADIPEETVDILFSREIVSGETDLQQPQALAGLEHSDQAKDMSQSLTLPGTSGINVKNKEVHILLERSRQQQSERHFAAQLLKVQVEEGGILDVTSGKRYCLSGALEKGLIDEETARDILTLQVQEGGIFNRQMGTSVSLREAVASGFIPPHIVPQVIEQLGGPCDSNDGKTVTVSEALPQGLINKNVTENLLKYEKATGLEIDPGRSVAQAIGHGHLDDVSANMLFKGQVISDGCVDPKQENGKPEITTAHLEEKDKQHADFFAKTEGKSQSINEPEEMKQIHFQMEISGAANTQHSEDMFFPEAMSKGILDKETVRSVCSKQLETGDITQCASGQCFSVEYALQHGLINEDLTDEQFKTEISNLNKEVVCNTLHSSDLSLNQKDLQKNATSEQQSAGEKSVNESSVPYTSQVGVSQSDEVSGKRCSASITEQSRVPIQRTSGVSCVSHEDALSEGNQMDNFGDNSSPFRNAAVESEQKNISPFERNSPPLSADPEAGVRSGELCTDTSHLQTSNLFSWAQGTKCDRGSIQERVKDGVDCPSDEMMSAPAKCAQTETAGHVIKVCDNIPVASEFSLSESTRQENDSLLRHHGHFLEACSQQYEESSPESETLNSVRDNSLKDVFKETLDSEKNVSVCTTEFLPGSKAAHTADAGTLKNDCNKMGFELDSSTLKASTVSCIFGENSTSSVNPVPDHGVDGDDFAAPQTSDFSSALRSRLQELVKMKAENADVHVLHKAETQVIEDIISMIKNAQDSSGRIGDSSASGIEEKEMPFSHINSRSPDLLVDLLKQEALRSKSREQLGDKESLSSEVKVLDAKCTSVVEQIQSQLLQMFQAASPAEDPAMIREVADELSNMVGNGICEDGSPNLPEAKRERAVSTAEDRRHCPQEQCCSSPPNDSIHIVLPEDDLTADNSNESDSTPQAPSTTQMFLESVGRLQDHSDVLEDMKNDLESQGLVSNSLEALKIQLKESQWLESQLSALAGTLTTDLKAAEQLLRSANEHIPTQIRRDLETVSTDLQQAFSEVCKTSSERRISVIEAIDSEKLKLEASSQDLLNVLEKLSVCIHETSETVSNLDIMNTDDLDTVKYRIQQNKDLENNLSVTQQQIEATGFDVQFFISEHAQDLSPLQSRQLLKSLSATQRAFKDLMEKVSTQRHTLDLHLEIRQDQSNMKSITEKQKEYTEKLQELCDHMTQTENRLIGHQQSAVTGDNLGDLQQYQKEHQALQKDVKDGESALAEVVRSTKQFLDENRDKLQPEQIAVIESKLEEAKSKSRLVSQRAEESRKDLDKVVTTAIKQETEKLAAGEQLEESKNKIEGLLVWLSNIGKDKEKQENLKDQVAKQNGNLPLEPSDELVMGEEDEANGNLLQTQGDELSVVDGREKDTTGLDLDRQYDRVKAHHQEVLSQQQGLIVATQSAQALLDKQAHMLSPEEKEKLQRDIQELKDRYETTLTAAEHKLKLIQTVQEELRKFESDCGEFDTWLLQSEGEMQELKTATSQLEVLGEKLKRQKSFSEDVISHKGDLRFITISGQRVLDAAKSCSKTDSSKDSELVVDTSGACAAVQDKLDSAASRYKALHSQCNQLGTSLRDVVEKYKRYEDASSGLLKWLKDSEEVAMKQLAETIAVDLQHLQKQLEDTKALQGQVSGRQASVEMLRTAAEALIVAEGDLLTNQDAIQGTVDDIVERYDNLSKSVSDRNEKLQITLTRSLSVQDGLDEMMDWMGGVERSLEEQDQVPLTSAAIQDVLSKNTAVEQDLLSRQSSISAMREKVNAFAETAAPPTAASLRAKMDALSQRFTDACDKHREKTTRLEELKKKVELFEKTSERVQQFVDTRSQALSETDGPGKNVNELSQLMQKTNAELSQHAKDVEMLQKLSKELSEMSPEGSKAQIQGKMETLSKNFKAFTDTVKEKEEEVSSCQGQLDAFKSAVETLRKWIEESSAKVPVTQLPCSVTTLETNLQAVNVLLEEWSSRAPLVQDINSKGSELCSLISVLTSPAKTKTAPKTGSALINVAGPRTQAYLTNKELTVVQHNVSYMNEGYNGLGALLQGRARELEDSLQKVREAREEGAVLTQWLEDMKKTAASWAAISTEAESMKAQMQDQKLFEEELNQKQGKLQQLRERLLDLIEKYPDSPETAEWKQMLDQIDSTWKDLSGQVEDRKQKLEESSKHLTQFQTAEAQLRQWLLEKELMMSVLGPLSVDPNMLNTQKQQVQILLNEFETRKSQYDQLNEAAQGMLSTPGAPPPASAVVREQLAAVADKWHHLTGQLSQRSEKIGQAIAKTTAFQSLLKSISDKVGSLDSELRGQPSLSTQPDAVKKQLEVAHGICSQLREEKKRVKEAETLCSDLSALVGEDYLKADLARQLESVMKPFKELEEKAVNRIQQLNSAFASSQQFHQMSKDLQNWLDEKMHEQSQSPLISAKVETLQQNLKEHTEFQKAVREQEAPFETLVKEGEALLQSTQGAEKMALMSQLSALKSNWDELKKSSAERLGKLQVCLQRAQKYKEHVEKLSPWIEECETKIGEVNICIDPAKVEDSISQVRTLQKDVDKHRGLLELLNNAADSLLEVSQADEDVIRDEKASINKKVDNMTEQLQLKKDSLEETVQRLKEFNESHKEAKGQLDGARKQLEAHVSLGAQAHSNKHFTNMKAQQKTLTALKTQVDYLKNLAQGLVVDIPDATGVSDLLLQVDSLEKDYKFVNKEMEEACLSLEARLQGIGQFQNSIREMFSQFADFDDELDSMAPVGRDLDTLQSQKDDIQGFIGKLQELMTNTVNANMSCKKMLETEASPDLIGLKRDLEALNKQCTKLMDRARGREEQVESTLTRVDELYKKLKKFLEKLGFAEEHEESQGPVGLETETINQQLDTFKVFQKEEIEPLQLQLQDLNWLGQGLIQSAAKSSRTQSLEQDLEDVNTRWNTLNKKVAERATQLHEALLHCGRFQDALESLLSWLTDTEDLVANQKPPSAEFKVVKAQIQEQKLLQRLLDDRKPTVELIKNEEGKMSELAEPADKEKLLKEIGSLGQRWDTLLKKAESRHRQLESILVVAQQFHETLEPVAEWLTATEKRLANSEPIGTQTKKLEQQISQHKALEEEIMGHSKNLHQALSLGQTLKTLSCPDDKQLVQARLDATQAHFIELQERCRRKAAMLQQAFSNAQHFGEDEVALMNWLNEVHEKLSDLCVQDYNTEVLQKQHTEQLALHEDIFLRKQNVDLAIQNGLELLKQTTGDEVVVIQGKLDGIKARYTEINVMSSSVSKTLDQALSLATKVQQTHEELCVWLDSVEAELVAFEAQVPVGEQLSQVQERQKELLKEAREHKALVDSLNEVSSALLELVPWRAREGLDKLVSEDNDRYKSATDAISQHVEAIDAAILKSQQFEQAADAEVAWLTEAERKLTSMGEIRLEPDQTTAQLQTQKAFSMDIMRHKDTIDGIVKTGEALMKSRDEEEKQCLQEKIKTLLDKYNAVSQMSSERSLQLERAQSLASQFWETYEELWPWLQETRSLIDQLPPPAIEYDTLKHQQEELRQLRELIAEHKPHIDKMNKTGPQLLGLSPVEGVSVREKYTATDRLYAQLKEDVKERAAALDEAISKSTQFHDKIDPMLESLERIVDRLRQPPSISVEVEKIKEQIAENKSVSVDLEKLQPAYDTLKQRGEEMIARSEGADKDISAKAVQDKLDQMVFIWEDIQALLEEREAKLLDVMDLAEKFWCDHCALIVTIKDTHDLLRELEEPGVDPSVVKQQQESVESFKEEIDGLQEELDVVRNLGAELLSACGEPDKPVIKKSIDEVNSAWETLNKTWKERVDRLEDAMQAAVQFQDGLQGLFDWVDIVENKLDSMSPVGTDLETVKQQIEELKDFKGEAYQLQIEMERLNHQAEILLKKVAEESDKCTIQEPLTELKMLWDNLDEKIINRQHKLEGALLALGQFQHALDELLAWLTHTEELLNEQRKAGGDPKAIEIQLAKHHVLQNDVLAHKTTVEAVNKAGNDLIESSAGEEASSLQSKLENLNQRWQTILEKTEQRRQHLDNALLQAQGFHGEIEDMQQWLKDTERQLLASKAVGGLPETAREQLNVHLELCSVFEAKEELCSQLMQRGQHLLTIVHEGHDSNTEQDLRNLKEKWESVQTKMTERKAKLEEALALATEFHNSLQDFINWLTQAEQTLTMASPASLILETIMFQIDEHKVFVTEVNSHREQIIELDKTGTHLKYFSQKQDVVLIKNLLISVQSRWEKVVQRSVERGRILDDSRKRAKQFHEAWNKLTEWLEESEKALDSELEIANDPGKIKMQLAQHKEFQKALGGKHSVYDTTIRTGRALKEKTCLHDDNQKLDDMLSELRDKWDTVCGKSVERQNKLEEALLFSGQFTDALQALIDWLYKVEPQLAEDQPVHGDIDLVLNLIDNHKVFQKELGKRTGSVQALKRSARELIESSHDDSSWVKVQMQELSTRWETVCALSVSKQTRLEQALCQAEEFHSTVHILLEWLAEAEQSLRFHGTLPDDEEALRTLIDQHKEFMKKLEEKRVALTKAMGMGEAILTICHPDSITTIKHWNTIIKARFEEVLAWAKQHQQRLGSALSELLSNQELLENLLGWLQWAETTVKEKDKETLPEEIEEVKTLIAEHQTFMEEMTRKQPDVDRVTKTHKRKAVAEPVPVQSHIPVLDKGRGGRKRSPTQGMYPSAPQAQIETKNPRVNLLVSKWQQVWLLALDRRRKLNDALDRLEELREFANFDFDVWRKKYMRWMNHKKSRVMDFFRRIDKDQDGKITRQEFIDGILTSKFPTSRLEMSAVADIFDRDGDGYIDYYEFVAALHPNKDAYKPLTDADKIEDEVTRQVAKCKCPKRFQVEQIGANKYRFYLGNQFGLVHCLHDPLIADETIANRDNQNVTPQLQVAVLESCILFGDSQQLRLVRILRSTVMVRVGGGWMALDEFLVKNDPCRVHHHGSKMLRSESNSSITTQSPIAKGRTNMELREKFMLPEGATQMISFRYRGRRSRPSSRAASPNRSYSSHSASVPPIPAASTPKTPQHLTRNYDKPWLTNSKTSTPIKSADSFESQLSSTEGTPIQGSKLRLPGYLSGKGFHSGEEGSLISAAASRAKSQAIESKKIPSRPGSRAGSKAGSRGSSRRGSDASDFDISDIQSVCSDMSETVPDASKLGPRAGPRTPSAKPSKIPTPQRRTPAASKLAKPSKR